MAKVFEHSVIQAGNRPLELRAAWGFPFATWAETGKLTLGTGPSTLEIPGTLLEVIGSPNVAGDSRTLLEISAMATIDEDLNQIERDVRTLKIEYEQFFGGGRSRPPTDTQWRVDTLVRRYAERVAELSSGQRFRYNNLTQTYAKYQDLWRKKLMQKEGGVSLRHFGAAAKAIEAQRSREDAHRQKDGGCECGGGGGGLGASCSGAFC